MSSRRPSVFRLGLVVNPFAGVGGPIANKGSDDPETQALASQGVLCLQAPRRVKTFLDALESLLDEAQVVSIVTVKGAMGSDYLTGTTFLMTLLDRQPQAPSTGHDTEQAVSDICKKGVDLLVFVGGDGTARDVCRSVVDGQLCLGVPSGVKMHSGVYAINPQLAANVVAVMVRRGVLGVKKQEVRDIDEQAFRQGRVKSQFFGELLVPNDERYVQNVKQGGFEIEEQTLFDIAEYLLEALPKDCLMIMGPGSTTLTIQKNWGLAGTLLGVDLIKASKLLAQDVSESQVLQMLSTHKGPVALIITVIGGQGHIIGRGNQQLSASVLRKIGRENVHIVATKTKIDTLTGRAFMMDSGDAQLDRQWQGFLPVLTGFDDLVIYPVGCGDDA